MNHRPTPALLLAGLAALAGVTLAACGSSAGEGTVAPLSGGSTSFAPVTTTATADAASTTASTGAVASTTTVAGAPARTPVAGVTARSVVFRQFTVSVSEAVTSRQTPDSFDDPSARPDTGDATYLYVRAKVANELDFAAGFVSTDEVWLAPASGEPIKADDATGTVSNVLDGGTTGTGWWAFELPAGADPAKATLLFGAAGEQRERLPLTGDVPAPTFPKTITVASPGELRLRNGDTATFVVRITIDSATLTNAVAYDHGRESEATEQALDGRRWLQVAFTANLVSTNSASSTSEVLGFDVARLVIDGDRQPGSPEISDSEILEVGTPYRGVVVFDVPTTGKVQLAWGDTDTAVLVDVPVA